MWAAGIVMYWLLFHRHPFQGLNQEQIKAKLRSFTEIEFPSE